MALGDGPRIVIKVEYGVDMCAAFVLHSDVEGGDGNACHTPK